MANWEEKKTIGPIRLLNNKLHGLSPSGGHHSLLFDQGFPNQAGLQGNQNAIWQYFVLIRLYRLLPTYLPYANFLDMCWHTGWLPFTLEPSDMPAHSRQDQMNSWWSSSGRSCLLLNQLASLTFKPAIKISERFVWYFALKIDFENQIYTLSFWGKNYCQKNFFLKTHPLKSHYAYINTRFFFNFLIFFLWIFHKRVICVTTRRCVKQE